MTADQSAPMANGKPTAANSADVWEPAWQIGQKQARLLNELAQKHSEAIRAVHSEALQARMSKVEALMPDLLTPDATHALNEYVQDAWQRWILFLDILRERGNSYVTREKEGFKPVLAFDYEMIMDGRRREQPVNYALVRIDPPAGYPPRREDGRPFVIIDPRAGHGSGIGGFKAESEVGVALRDGHPVYFVIFFPNPEAEQTLADVCAAEAAFL